MEIIAHMAVTGLALILGISAWVYAITQKRAAIEMQRTLRERIDQLENELTALMDGSFGMGSQLEEISRDLKGTIDRQQQLEQRDLGDLPYNEAVRLVAAGASAEQLVQNCGLSKSEADLVLLLHKASPPIISPEQASRATKETADQLDNLASAEEADSPEMSTPFREQRLHEIKRAPVN